MDCCRRQMLLQATRRRQPGISIPLSRVMPSLSSAVSSFAPTEKISTAGPAGLFSPASAQTPALSRVCERPGCTSITGVFSYHTRTAQVQDSFFQGNALSLPPSFHLSRTASTRKKGLPLRSHRRCIRTARHVRCRVTLAAVEDAEPSKRAAGSCGPAEVTSSSATSRAALGDAQQTIEAALERHAPQEAENKTVRRKETGEGRTEARPRREGDRSWWYGALQRAFQREIREWFVQKKQGTLFHIWRAPGVVFASTKLVKSGVTPPPLSQWYFPASIDEQQLKSPSSLQSLFRLNHTQETDEEPEAPGAVGEQRDAHFGSSSFEESFPTCSLFFLSSSKSSAGFLMQQVVLHPETLYVAVAPDYDALFTLLRLAARAFCMDPCGFQQFPNLRVLCTHPLHVPSFLPNNLVNEVYIHLSDLPRSVASRSTSRCPLLSPSFLPQLYPRLRAGTNIFIGMETPHARPGAPSGEPEMSSGSITHRRTALGKENVEAPGPGRPGETSVHEPTEEAGDPAVQSGHESPQEGHAAGVLAQKPGTKESEEPSCRDTSLMWTPDAHVLRLLRVSGCVKGLEAADVALPRSLRVPSDARLYRTRHTCARAVVGSKNRTGTRSGSTNQRKGREFLFSVVGCDGSGDVEGECRDLKASASKGSKSLPPYHKRDHFGHFCDREITQGKEGPSVSANVNDSQSDCDYPEAHPKLENRSTLQQTNIPDVVAEDGSAILNRHDGPDSTSNWSIRAGPPGNQLQNKALEDMAAAEKGRILSPQESDGWFGIGPFVPTRWGRPLPVSQHEPGGTAPPRHAHCNDRSAGSSFHRSNKPTTNTNGGTRILRLATGGRILIREWLRDGKEERKRTNQQLLSHTDGKASLIQSGVDSQGRLLDDASDTSRIRVWTSRGTESGVSFQYVKLRKLAPCLPNFRLLEHCL